MKRYALFLMLFVIFCVHYSPMTTAQTDRRLADYPVITAENVAGLQQLRVLGEGYINDVIFSPDEQFVAMATTVGIWLYSIDDLENPIHLFGDYAINVTYAMFSPDGSRLFGGVLGGSVYIWDFASWDLINILEDTHGEDPWNYVLEMELSDDGQMLYVIVSTYLAIWNLADSNLVKEIELYRGCEYRYTYVLSPNKNYILLSCFSQSYDINGRINYYSHTDLISLETGVRYPIESEREIYSVHFNDDGTRVIGQRADGFYEIWDTETQALLYHFGESLEGYKSPIYAKSSMVSNLQSSRIVNSQYPEIGVLTDDDSKFIVLSGYYGAIWDIATNTRIHTFYMDGQPSENTPFKPYETFQLISSIDEAEALALVEEHDVIHRIRLYFYSQASEDVIAIYPTPQFKHFVAVTDENVLIWDGETGDRILNINLLEPCRHARGTILSLNNTRLVDTLSYNRGRSSYVCIWDVENLALLYSFISNEESYSTTISEDYFFIAVPTENDERFSLQLWNLTTDTSNELIEIGFSSFQNTGEFSENSKFLGGLLGSKAMIWELETGKLIKSERLFGYNGGSNLIFSPNSGLVAFNVFSVFTPSSRYHRIYVWDTSDWSLAYQSEKYLENWVNCFQFSSQSRFLLVGYDGMMDLLDAKTGELLVTLPYNCQYFMKPLSGNPHSVFNYDDSQIVAVDGIYEANLSIIDTNSFEHIYLTTYTENNLTDVRVADFSPVTNLLLVIIGTGDVFQIWDMNTYQLVYEETFLSGIFDARFSKDGKLITLDMKDGTVRIFGVPEA